LYISVIRNKNKFDLALIDISLPDGNGFTICTEIKEKQDIPVIFLTASGESSDSQSSRKAI
jgi:two-component system, OmpR family, response regulator MtrA